MSIKEGKIDENNIAIELNSYNQQQAKLESDFSDILKICEEYEANSFFHCLLKYYLIKEIQIPPIYVFHKVLMEEEDTDFLTLNKLKLIQAET
jgi:hypothetical protein